MFLAWHEMKYEKLRYGLIITVIGLIAFLIFIISALALGLAHQNTAAIDSWNTKSALMNKDANGNMGQSVMTESELAAQTQNKQTAVVGITPTNISKTHKSDRDAVQFIGINSDEYIAQNLKLSKGHQPKHQNEVIISDKLSQYKVNDKIRIGLDDTEYTVSGVTPDALYNMAPVVYGNLKNWSPIKGINPTFKASGLISKSSASLKTNDKRLKVYDRQSYLDNLPGYTAQKMTFIFMIVFLILISLIVVTIFLYILTIQKLPNLAVLRAQGIPNRYLVQNTFNETLLIMILAIGFGAVLTAVSAFFMPNSVPVYFDLPLMLGVAGGILETGLLGSFIPMWVITKIDPVTVIGG